MGRAVTFIDNYLKHALHNTTFPNIGDVTGLLAAATVGSVWVELHTADPGTADSQTTSEATYTGYGRVSLNRNATDIDITGGVASNLIIVTFPKNTGADQTVTHTSFGFAQTGAGQIYLSGALSSPFLISTNTTPQFAVGQLTWTAT